MGSSQKLGHIDHQPAILPMNEAPLVSIIIPHFNRSLLLVETLASVYKQTYANWEVIIVDDGSRDDELSAVERLTNARVRVLIRTDGEKGPSRCRNLGAQAAKGKFLLFLDSDDLLAPWCLESRVQLLQCGNADAVILPVAIFRKNPGDERALWNDLNGDNDIDRFTISDPVWHTSSPLWMRNHFLLKGGFNERVMYGDDSELHLRCLLNNSKFRKFPHELPDAFVRRAEQERITGSITNLLIQSRRIRLEVGSDVVEQSGRNELCELWQSQYVAECEFLLFNAPQAKSACNEVIADWNKRWSIYPIARKMFQSYINLGWKTRDKARIVLRVARRLIIHTTPRCYYPRVRCMDRYLSDTTLIELRAKLNPHVEKHAH
ncbi:MAG: glycosyltransferase family 2 protein [Planctomycetaceae bacterium]|nr:glycosyltransferase family 2 protein [Planctomycetaceae bacterium]